MTIVTLDRRGWRLAVLAAAWTGVAGLGIGQGQAAAPSGLPPGPGRDLVMGTCQTCHSLTYLSESKGIDRSQWDGLLSAMQQYGLQVTPANRKAILDYLATYLGPKPPPAPKPATAAAAAPVDAASLYQAQCSGCHQQSGEGVAGSFPPLAGNADLMADRTLPARVVLHGMTGPISVEGGRYDGVMPAFGYLSDAQIAAVVNYVRSSWGNDALAQAGTAPVDAATVTALRAEAMTPAEVHAYRAKVTQPPVTK